MQARPQNRRISTSWTLAILAAPAFAAIGHSILIIGLRPAKVFPRRAILDGLITSTAASQQAA
jgi:hypothetical protein